MRDGNGNVALKGQGTAFTVMHYAGRVSQTLTVIVIGTKGPKVLRISFKVFDILEFIILINKSWANS